MDARGRVRIDLERAAAAARGFWELNRPAPAAAFRLEGVRCADAVGPRELPGCELTVGVSSAGFFRPVGLKVRSVAYILSGVTAEGR